MTTATRPRDRLTRAEAHSEILKLRRWAGLLAGRVAGDHDENFAEAMLGLCEAAAEFEPSRGLKFSTLGTWKIRERFRDMLRSRRTGGLTWAPTALARPCLPLTDAHRDQELRDRVYVPAVCDPEPDLDAADLWRLVRKHAACRLDYLIVRAVFAHGLTQEQVADGLGLTRNAVSQRVVRTLKRLRERAAEFEGFR